MPEKTSKEHSVQKLLMWAGGLVVVLALIGLLAGSRLLPRGSASDAERGQSLGDIIRSGEAPQPAYTPEVEEKLRMSTGFDVLVSYTDRGFEPSSVAVDAGDTVRFTNNSSQPLTLTIVDSSVTILPQDFHEATFEMPGEFGYTDGVTSGKMQVR